MIDVMISGTVVFVGFIAMLVYGGYKFITMTSASDKEVDMVVDNLEKIHDTVTSPTYNKLEVHGVKDTPKLFPFTNGSELGYEIISNKHMGERIIQFDDGVCYPLPVRFYVQVSSARNSKQITFAYKGKYLGSASVVGGLDNFKKSFDDTYRKHILSIMEDNSEIRWSGLNSKVKYQDPEFFKEYSGLAELLSAVKVVNTKAA